MKQITEKASFFAFVRLLGAWTFLVPELRSSEPEAVQPEESQVVWVLDIEKLSRGEILTATAIQGLANRSAPRVFLRQTQRFWPVSFSYYKNYREKIGPEVLAKYPSPDFFWIEYYSKKWGYTFQQVADLSDLLERNAGVVKGAIRLGGNDTNAEAVAATIAGLQDLVPINDEALRHSPHLASLPVVVDLRERFPANATRDKIAESLLEAISEFLPKTSKSMLFSYFPAQFGYLTFDLAIANRAFCFSMGHVDPKATDPESRMILANEWTPSGLNHEEQKRLLDLIYEHLEPYGMVWGWDAQSENAIATKVAKNGSAATCCTANNLSFHASVPAKNRMMPRQRRLDSEKVIVEDKYYIAFVSGAGDAAHTSTSLMCNGRWIYSGRGRVPMNWTTSPYVVKTLPGMMEAYYEQRSATDYFVNETSGYGYNHPSAIPDEFLFGYAQRIREASSLSDTQYTDLWWAAGIHPESKFRAWQKATGMSGFFSWQQTQQVLYPEDSPIEICSERYFSDYWPKDDPKKTPRALADSLMAQLKDVPRPWFTVVYDLDPNFAAETMAILPSDQFKAVLMDEFFVAAEKAKENIQGRNVPPIREKKSP
jgi:hypothetical protein